MKRLQFIWKFLSVPSLLLLLSLKLNYYLQFINLAMNYDNELSTVYPIYHSKRKKGDCTDYHHNRYFCTANFFYWQFTKTYILLELFFYHNFKFSSSFNVFYFVFGWICFHTIYCHRKTLIFLKIYSGMCLSSKSE